MWIRGVPAPRTKQEASRRRIPRLVLTLDSKPPLIVHLNLYIPEPILWIGFAIFILTALRVAATIRK